MHRWIVLVVCAWPSWSCTPSGSPSPSEHDDAVCGPHERALVGVWTSFYLGPDEEPSFLLADPQQEGAPARPREMFPVRVHERVGERVRVATAWPPCDDSTPEPWWPRAIELHVWVAAHALRPIDTPHKIPVGASLPTTAPRWVVDAGARIFSHWDDREIGVMRQRHSLVGERTSDGLRACFAEPLGDRRSVVLCFDEVDLRPGTGRRSPAP